MEDAIDVRMGTLGKALGVCGAFVAGDRELVPFLRERVPHRTLHLPRLLDVSPAVRVDAGEGFRQGWWSEWSAGSPVVRLGALTPSQLGGLYGVFEGMGRRVMARR